MFSGQPVFACFLEVRLRILAVTKSAAKLSNLPALTAVREKATLLVERRKPEVI